MLRHFTFKTFLLGSYFAAWITYFFLFWRQAVFFDKSGNFFAGQVNIWGDWAAHFTMTTALATRGIFITSPLMVGTKFSYPFLADLVSAVLLRSGVPFIPAFVVPSFLFSVAIVVALFFFYRQIFRSRTIAILASLIFLFNGGIGFWYFVQDISHSPKPLYTLVNPPHEYTRLDAQHLKWISVVDSMIIPQRAFAMGFPVALIGLTLVWMFFSRQTARPTKRSWPKLVAGGLLIGSLPIIHTHSFLAVFIILACWCVGDLAVHYRKFWERVKWWLVLMACVAVLAIPIILAVFVGHVGSSFFQYSPGWLATGYDMNWLLFWWKNWGITPILAIVGAGVFLKKSTQPILVRMTFCLPFFLLFILPNLFLFQPFDWDNTKIIAWASVGFSALAAYTLYYLARKKFIAFKILAVLLFFFAILSGAIDAYWDIRHDLHSYQMYSAADESLASWVKMNTDPNSIWLTSDQHNHWLYNLTGRQPVLTFLGWLWTHGYNYAPVERDAATMFAGTDETLPLLQKYHVNYVVIGTSELINWHANEGYYLTHFPVVKEDPSTRIFKIQ